MNKLLILCIAAVAFAAGCSKHGGNADTSPAPMANPSTAPSDAAPASVPAPETAPPPETTPPAETPPKS